MKQCLDCSKQLKDYRSTRCVFCARKGKNNPNYKDGRSLKKTYCMDCGKELKKLSAKRCRLCSRKFRKKPLNYCKDCGKKINYKSKRCHSCGNKFKWKNPKIREKLLKNNKRNLGNRHSIHTKLLYSKTRKGENNGNWKGGVSGIFYPSEFNNELKKKIYRRDNFTCQLCFKYPCNYLNAHHIDYNKQNCKEENLITLCKSCHNKTNNNRKYWRNYFQRRMDYACI